MDNLGTFQLFSIDPFLAVLDWLPMEDIIRMRQLSSSFRDTINACWVPLNTMERRQYMAKKIAEAEIRENKTFSLQMVQQVASSLVRTKTIPMMSQDGIGDLSSLITDEVSKMALNEFAEEYAKRFSLSELIFIKVTLANPIMRQVMALQKEMTNKLLPKVQESLQGQVGKVMFDDILRHFTI